MQRSTDRMYTTHVGSLARPAALLDLMRAAAAGEPVDESLCLVRWTFLTEEVQNNANSFFRGTPLDANVGDETPDQVFHDPCPPH